jgi:hypothetical protein
LPPSSWISMTSLWPSFHHFILFFKALFSLDFSSVFLLGSFHGFFSWGCLVPFVTYGVLTRVLWIAMKSWLIRLKRRTSWYYLVNTWDFFILVELEEGNGESFHTNVMVQDVLANMRVKGVCLGLSSVSLWMSLRSWQGFVVPTIIGHARSTKEAHCTFG